MVCQSCSATNAETHKYCADCGVKLETPNPALAAASPEPAVVYTALDRGDTDAALDAALKALAEEPDSIPAHLALAAVYERRGDHEEAAHQRRLVVSATSAGEAPPVEEVLPAPVIAAHRPRWLLAAGAAVCFGLVVTGIGVGQMLATSQRTSGASSQTLTTGTSGQMVLAPQPGPNPANGTAAVTGSTAPVGPPLPGAARARIPRPGNAVVSQPYQQRYSTAPTFPEPVRRIGLPQVVDHAPARPPEPLTAATVGDVTPIGITPPKQVGPLPGTTGTTLPLTGAVTGPRTGPTSAGNGGVPENQQKSGTNTELPSPETGFIRIERNGGAPRERGPETPPTGGASPSGERGGTRPAPEAPRPQPALMGQARRAERLGSEALREGLALEAQEHFTAAYRLYATVVSQGGPEAQEARARARYCAQALSTLR